MTFDRRNVLVVCITTLLISAGILFALVTANAQNTRRDRAHIAACATVTGNLERAICLGRQP